MSRERRSLWLSAAGVAFMFFICPPTGIALGILRGKYDDKSIRGKSRGLRIAGGISIAIFVLMVYGQLFQNPNPPPYSQVILLAGILYLLPGLSMIRAGNRVIKSVEKEAPVRRMKWEELKAIPAAHRPWMFLKRWFRFGNVLRVIGLIFLIFFGLVVLVLALSKQENELEILIIFFFLFCLPGTLMYWAGPRLNRKEDQAQPVPNGFSGKGKESPSQTGRNTDQEWKKYSREPIPKRPASSYTTSAAMETASAQSPPSPPRRMICPGCGAQNTVPAHSSVACEYCGSTLTNL
ncbi:MAG: hypothetical protein E6230_08975 [Paenibacillus dendritiformis]|uniref:hypothetical protein n=1 Tax=Paenibacillus dendritiformis TaxID=130049 RepID=UPI001B29FEFB|nr:hypothetical protein [Paenibacillus dendritiformis]MDU5142305.1 hypothetical protein [Paenibacillus dendritiformis]GIO73705.1 hypothetical protein J27TS7_32190 [Paenibacillus dendritiformis]